MLYEALLSLISALSQPLQPAELIECHDGDTCRFNIQISQTEIDLGMGVWQRTVTVLKNQTVRLCDIDAPELATREGPNARDALLSWLRSAKRVEVKLTGGREKYGRLLGWLYADGESLNDRMVKQGFASTYKLLCQPPKSATPSRTRARQVPVRVGLEPCPNLPNCFLLSG